MGVGATATAESPKRRRRWLRFGLRSLLLTWIALAIWLGWWTYTARQQRDAVAKVQNLSSTWGHLGTSTYYSYQIIDESRLDRPPTCDADASSWVPRFALDRLGRDYFHNVVYVEVWPDIFWRLRGDKVKLAAELGKLRSLRHLIIANLDVSDEMLQHLVGLRQLRSLELRGVSDESLRLISRLPRLQSLEVHGEFTDAGLANLRRMRTLRRLEIDSPHPSDEGLRHISQLPNLESLRLGSIAFGPDDFTAQGFEKLANCRKLSSLSFWRTTGVTDEDLRGIAAIGTLEELDLSGADISDAGIQHLLRLTTLRQLVLEYTLITDKAMPSIARLSNLEHIHLNDTASTDAAIATLVRLPKLQSVTLRDGRVTASALELFTRLPELHRLRILRRSTPMTDLLVPLRKRRGLSANDMIRLQQLLPRCEVTTY
jgi:hypothetical protein